MRRSSSSSADSGSSSGSHPSAARRRAISLLGLAVVSAGVTAQVAVVGGPSTVFSTASSEQPTDVVRPSVPQAAIEAPASLSADEGRTTFTSAQARTVARDAAVSSIPGTALTAYQRAEVVINDADPGCQLPWELVAAIGRVESDHGRYGGSELDAAGVATPGIYGIALDGTHRTRAIPDTDGGRYDDDIVWDRAVGPMQFIPSTWAVVGVDGDNDGRRDPQNIHDAALAGAVYLCSGDDDLATDAGRRAAVHRYNHSDSYVATVLAVMDSYLAGDWSASGSTAQAGAQVLDPTAPSDPSGPKSTVNGPHSPTLVADGPRAGATPGTTAPEPSDAPKPTVPSLPKPQPSKQPPGTPKPTPGPKPSVKPKPTPTLPPNPLAPVTDPLAPVTDPILEPVLTLTDALDLCAAEFAKIPDPLGLLNGAKRACADEVIGKPLSQATALIPNTLRGLLSWLGLVKPKP